jgi:hypothetical protein
MYSKQFKQELDIAQKYAWEKYKREIFIHKLNYYKIIILYKIMHFLWI